MSADCHQTAQLYKPNYDLTNDSDDNRGLQFLLIDGGLKDILVTDSCDITSNFRNRQQVRGCSDSIRLG